MPYLKIKSPLLNIDVTFKDKYAFIIGDSGVGKSLMINRLADAAYCADYVDSDLRISVITSSTTSVLDNVDKGWLIVSDEVVIRPYISKLAKYPCYFLVVTRKIYKNINFSYRCLYTTRREGLATICEPIFNTLGDTYLNKYSLIITEDSKYGYDFISKCLDHNQCITKAGGKRKIVDALNNMSVLFETVLVVLDAGGIGTDIIDIMFKIKELKSIGVTVHLLTPECFEQLLLCSKYYNYDKDVFKYFSIEYNDTEKFCEEELSKVSNGTVLECLHHKHTMSECWMKQCSDCDTIDCSYRIAEDKFKHVLENGPANMLLELRKENKNEE